MPIVPRVTPEPLPGARVSGGVPAAPPDAAFGGGAGNVTTGLDEGLSDVAREVQQIAAQEKAKASEAILDDSRVQLGQFRQTLAAEYENVQGLDAPAQQEAYRQQYQAGVAKIRGALPNDDLRAAFDHVSVGDTLDFTDRLARHSYDQSQQADRATYLSRKQILLDDAIASAGDEAATGAIASQLDDLVVEHASRSGASAMTTEAERANERSNLHTAVVGALAAQGADLTAQRYLEQHRTDFVGQQRIDVEHTVRLASVKGESQRLFDSIMFTPPAMTGTPEEHALAALNHAPPTEEDALAAVRTQATDPDVRAAAGSLVERWFTDRRTAARDDAEEAMITGKNALDANGGNWHALLGTPGWQKLAPDAAMQLKRYGDNIRSGADVATNWSKYSDVVTMATTPATQAEFLQLNLPAEYLNDFAPPQLNYLIDLQGRYRSQDATERDKAAQELGQVRTTNQVVTDGLHAIGIGINPKKREQDDPIVNEVFEAVSQQVAAFQEREQRKATTPEVQGIVDELLTAHVVSSPGRLYGTNTTTKHLFEMGPDDSLVLTPKDIPARDLPQLDQWLRDHNQAATDTNRVTAYRSYLRSLLPRGPR